MAVTTTKLMDTDWRGQTIITMSAHNSAIDPAVDASGLQGWIAGSLLAISKLHWNLTAAVTISWGGTGGVADAFILTGNGSYGYTSGQPAIACTRTSSTVVTSDVIVTPGAACDGTIVIEYTKQALGGTGWSA